MSTGWEVVFTIVSILFFGYIGFLISADIGKEAIDWVYTGLLVTILFNVISIKRNQNKAE